MLHRSAALSIAVLALATASPAVAAGSRTVGGAGFTTRLPAGWSSHVKTTPVDTQWRWGSKGTAVSLLGIPAKGGIGVSAVVTSTTKLQRRIRGRLARSPVALLAQMIGTPTAASHARAVTPAHATTLAGVKAGAATLSYTYRGRSIVQSDVVARHGGSVYFVELDVDQANAARGQAALRSILAAWRFSAARS